MVVAFMIGLAFGQEKCDYAILDDEESPYQIFMDDDEDEEDEEGDEEDEEEGAFTIYKQTKDGSGVKGMPFDKKNKAKKKSTRRGSGSPLLERLHVPLCTPRRASRKHHHARRTSRQHNQCRVSTRWYRTQVRQAQGEGATVRARRQRPEHHEATPGEHALPRRASRRLPLRSAIFEDIKLNRITVFILGCIKGKGLASSAGGAEDENSPLFSLEDE